MHSCTAAINPSSSWSDGSKLPIENMKRRLFQFYFDFFWCFQESVLMYQLQGLNVIPMFVSLCMFTAFHSSLFCCASSVTRVETLSALRWAVFPPPSCHSFTVTATHCVIHISITSGSEAPLCTIEEGMAVSVFYWYIPGLQKPICLKGLYVLYWCNTVSL